MTATQQSPKKLTARNCAELANIRRAMNRPIFQRCVKLMNEEGRDAVRAYLAQFFNRPEAAAETMEGR